MSQTTNSVLTELRDPKISALARRVLSGLRLAATRVAAHHADPRAYAMPSDAGAIEHLLAERFNAMAPDKRRRSAERAVGLMSRAVDRERAFGPLARLGLDRAVAVKDLARDLIVPANLGIDRAYLDTLRPVAAPSSGLRPLQTLDKLEFRIHKVRCKDETDPEFGASDTILCGGTTVDETGDTKKVSSFKVGNFNDGTVKTYNPPRQFTMFSVLEGNAWPKTYYVTVVLAEQDNGGFPAFLQKLYEGVKGYVIAALASALGALIGSSGGIVGTIIGAVVGWIVGKLFQWFKDWWEDDEFIPVTVSCTHAGINARWANGATDSPEGYIWWKGHGGHYEMYYDWRLYH
jgi:hypothetical protein